MDQTIRFAQTSLPYRFSYKVRAAQSTDSVISIINHSRGPFFSLPGVPNVFPTRTEGGLFDFFILFF